MGRERGRTFIGEEGKGVLAGVVGKRVGPGGGPGAADVVWCLVWQAARPKRPKHTGANTPQGGVVGQGIRGNMQQESSSGHVVGQDHHT